MSGRQPPLTRDWALAEDLLQTSLVKAWSAWHRIEVRAWRRRAAAVAVATTPVHVIEGFPEYAHGARLSRTSLADEFGIEAGMTATMTMTMTGAPSAEFGVAVGSAVDPSDYPYPPRPTMLKPLAALPPSSPEAWYVVRADPTNPLRVLSATFPWPSGRRMNLWANTPAP